MYVPEPTAEEVRRATGSAARAVPTSAEALIQLRPEEDFEGYLKRFTSAKRNKFKREIRAFEAAGGKLAVRRLSEVAESVGPLLGDLHQRHGDDGSTAETMTRYLASQAAVLDEWSRVFVEERDGRITAFALAYAYDGCLYGRAAGFDRAAGVSPFAYFNLAFYAPLRYAADHGLSAVDLGTGAYQGKVLRGAELRPLWSAVWPPNDSEPAWLEALDHPAAEAVEAGVAKGHAHRSCTMTPSA